jgi:hypothetical protein
MPAMGITEEIILKRECASHDVQFQQILNEIFNRVCNFYQNLLYYLSITRTQKCSLSDSRSKRIQ